VALTVRKWTGTVQHVMLKIKSFIFPCTQILGGVLVVNATTTSNHGRNVGLFQYVQPAIGIGIRVMVNKHFRTNVNFDFAIGTKSQGFYFDGQETF
jgi:hypothetical protein